METKTVVIQIDKSVNQREAIKSYVRAFNAKGPWRVIHWKLKHISKADANAIQTMYGATTFSDQYGDWETIKMEGEIEVRKRLIILQMDVELPSVEGVDGKSLEALRQNLRRNVKSSD